MDDNRIEAICEVQTMFFSVERRCVIWTYGEDSYTAIYDKTGMFIVEVVIVQRKKKDNPLKNFTWRKKDD